MGGGIAAVWFFELQAQGVAILGLIPQGLPALTLPDLTLIEQLVRGALGIALMSFTQSIAGRAFARPDDPPINANHELIATGAANLGAGRGVGVPLFGTLKGIVVVIIVSMIGLSSAIRCRAAARINAGARPKI